MTEPESRLPVHPDALPPDEPNQPPKASTPSRLRRFFLRHVPLTVAGLSVLLALTVIGLFFWASSQGFENLVRKELVLKLETATGGRVEIASFHWRLLNLEAEADGVVIHGLEGPGEAPYAQIERLRVQVSILNLWTARIHLRSLEVLRPALHLIVYPDGTTNQPQPRKPQKARKSALDTFFDLKAGRVAIEQGELHYENREASFDFQNRYIPLNFDASDVSLRLTSAAQTTGSAGGGPSSQGLSANANPESYRIEVGARDLDLSRGAGAKSGSPVAQPVHGFLQATLDLTRNAAYLRSLRITASSHTAKDRTLDISGSVEDFAHPRWQAKIVGQLDMMLLAPLTGYPNAPVGIAHLDLTGAGHDGQFRADGVIHVDNGSYIDSSVTAVGVNLDAHIHADPTQLVITSIVARLRQGGQLDGEVALNHWLPPIPGAAIMQPEALSSARAATGNLPLLQKPHHPPPVFIPVNGLVKAELRGVALDTVMDMVAQGPFQRLGMDASLSGSATATWNHGDPSTTVVSAVLNMTPPDHAVAGEAPASGVIDATYTQRDGAVDLRKLELRMPGSQLEAHGHLGAYPITSPSALAVELHTRNLWEFNPVLRDLGLAREGKTGTAALPVSLAGQADFLGVWIGSVASPHLSGNLKATQLMLEIPPMRGAKNSQPQLVRWDAVDATGSYSATRIDLSHAVLQRGNAEIVLNGSLVAATDNTLHGKAPAPIFNSSSSLRLHLRAAKVGVDQLLPLLGQKLPVTGTLDAQADIDGPIRDLDGSGWAELDGGSVLGEPIKRIRAQGTIAGQVLKLTSVTASAPAGKVSASGSYGIQTGHFQLNATGAGIDISRLQSLGNHGLQAGGKLGFSLGGSGTLNDPRLEAHATLSNLAENGEVLGGLDLVAHTANRTATYDMTSRLEAAAIKLHGQTSLGGEYETQARLEFSHFDIGALLKLAHVTGLNGESSLAGTVTLVGPLAQPEKLHGEARLPELTATVAGVHLRSDGGVHATLADARVNLDPVHITGEATDLRAQGSLVLNRQRQLDFGVNGTINLKVAETLDPDLTASGTSTFQLEAHGTLQNPGLQGRVDFQNGSLALGDMPNGLSQLHGTLVFNQNRLEVKSLTALSGGGLLSVGGYLAYQNGIYADLAVSGNGIRIRYPEGVSSLADAALRLRGTQNNLLLSGNVVITRFTISPDLDMAALVAQASAVETIAPPNSPSNHIRLDVHIGSSPQLNFQNAYAKLAGDIDLRLRGTIASPSLLGRISITEGNALIAGTRYELQRGDVNFTNPVRIEPTIDLNASARVQDYDITLGLHGPPGKLAVTYHSDPPLPEADVVALLALGRTENQQRLYTQQQMQSGANPTTDALLGGALNATVSSRVQRLFGAGSVKVDPNYLGTLGNSTSRIIVEEQLGRNVTFTYATNVNTTGQQLLQAEIAINRHVSLLVARDESGVFSMVVKATRRFR